MFRNSRPALDRLDARRICILKPSALGDIVHALPVLTALRNRFPQASISWVVNRAYEPLLRGHPDLDETLGFDRGGLRKLGLWGTVSSLRQFLTELRTHRFDLVIDLQGLFRSGVMAWATRAARRVGLRGAREGAGWFYTDAIACPPRKEAHAVLRYWNVARALGAAGSPDVFRFPAFAAEQHWAAETLAVFPRPWIAVAVGSRWLTKRWPPAHFGALLRRAQESVGGTALFVGAGEDTAASLEAARVLTGPTLQLPGRTTLPQLTALLARADVMVANDTGPLHLASALGKPVVAPYTCTRAALTGPHGQLHRAVETSVWCAGSLLRRCPRMECMTELTPERLWPVLCEVLDRWPRNSLSA